MSTTTDHENELELIDIESNKLTQNAPIKSTANHGSKQPHLHSLSNQHKKEVLIHGCINEAALSSILTISQALFSDSTAI